MYLGVAGTCNFASCPGRWSGLLAVGTLVPAGVRAACPAPCAGGLAGGSIDDLLIIDLPGLHGLPDAIASLPLPLALGPGRLAVRAPQTQLVEEENVPSYLLG